ncbi:MAG: helix-turn-helix domain-containing protein [Oscillospiraceae bacterium]|jgi:transcriptional regulator with XRE-family HTH domain|nr:helix-turn-helix domain-containing protein [Oscillospiraceae bacterium]
MNIKIGENLKRLRRGRDMTQEELAVSLGVSNQAISKWERCDGYPDMEILPAIAAYFDVSLDELVGMDEIRSNARRDEMFKQGQDFSLTQDYDRAIHVLTEAHALFPNDREITHWLAQSYYNPVRYGMVEGEKADDYLAEARRLSEQCAELPSVYSYLDGFTLERLIAIYLRVGEKDKAREIAKRLPLIGNSREVLMARQFESDEENDYWADLYWSLYYVLDQALHEDARRALELGDFERAKYLLGKMFALDEWLYDDTRDGDARFAGQQSAYYRLAAADMGLGDTDSALANLEKSYASLKMYPYNDMWFSGYADADAEQRERELYLSYGYGTSPLSWSGMRIIAHSALVRGFDCGYSVNSHPLDSFCIQLSHDVWNTVRNDPRFRAIADDASAWYNGVRE